MAEGNPEPGREIEVAWRGTSVRAWLPDPLSTRPLALSEKAVRETERAAAAARSLSGQIPAGFEPLARLLLRAEGLASSHVEGVDAPIEDIIIAEFGLRTGTPAHVADNLGAVEEALEHASGTAPLMLETIHDWHRRLMTRGPLADELVGRWRSELGWIGGLSPEGAVFVAAPPDSIDALMSDLTDVCNRCPWDPVTTSAMVHAQFETIHPYGDGNGRVGRVLALWVLARHLDDVGVPPPMSVLIARDTDGYIASLGAFRIGMDDQLIRWFAAIITKAGEASLEWAARLDALVDRWTAKTEALRADAAGRRIVPILARFPVLSVEIVAEQLGVTFPAARGGLEALADIGILEDRGTIAAGRGRPRRWWSAPELLELVRSWAI